MVAKDDEKENGFSNYQLKKSRFESCLKPNNRINTGGRSRGFDNRCRGGR
jgi:hypothetical protein